MASRLSSQWVERVEALGHLLSESSSVMWKLPWLYTSCKERSAYVKGGRERGGEKKRIEEAGGEGEGEERENKRDKQESAASTIWDRSTSLRSEISEIGEICKGGEMERDKDPKSQNQKMSTTNRLYVL